MISKWFIFFSKEAENTKRKFTNLIYRRQNNDKAMEKQKYEKGRTDEKVDKTLHRKLKSEKHETIEKPGELRCIK